MERAGCVLVAQLCPCSPTTALSEISSGSALALLYPITDLPLGEASKAHQTRKGHQGRVPEPREFSQSSTRSRARLGGGKDVLPKAGSSNVEHGSDPAQAKTDVFAGKMRTGLWERLLYPCASTDLCLYGCTRAFYAFQPGFKDLTWFWCTTTLYLTPARCFCP